MPIFPTDIYPIGKANNSFKYQLKILKICAVVYDSSDLIYLSILSFFSSDNANTQEEIIYGISATSSSTKYKKL